MTVRQAPRLARTTSQGPPILNAYDPIGSYGGATIFRYAVIDGERYEFDYASGSGPATGLAANQRYISPGLVYARAPVQDGDKPPI